MPSLYLLTKPYRAKIGGAFTSLPAVDGVFGLNNWDVDSETPDGQQTWLNFVLPQLACKCLSFPCST